LTDSFGDGIDGWLRRLGDGSETAELVRTIDWSQTPLGSPETWSVGLRSAVGVCLSSRFPMLVVWGPELTKIYNDGYRAILGTEKHPQAMGAPAKLVWSEIWDLIGPRFDQVLTTGEATWSEHELLVIERNGFPEECYFTYSYSPLFDDDGRIGGVLDVVQETTDEVVARRRLRCLADLGSSLFEAAKIADVCRRAVAALARWRSDIRAVNLHLRFGERLALVSSNPRPDMAEVDPAILAEVVERNEPMVIGGESDVIRPARLYAAPIGGPEDGVRGVLTFSLNPQRPFDRGYQEFLDLVAKSVAAALDTAYRRTAEVGEYRHISETLQAAMLQPASNFQTVFARYLPVTGNLAVGGDWYDVIDLGDERRAIVVGDCVGHGLEAATVMSQLRSATRAMLLEGRDPAETLEALDAFAESIPGAECSTAVCAIVDRRRATLTYSRAGHLPPIVAGKRGVRWLDKGSGPPLAVMIGAERVNEVHRLMPDDMIVCYSDGLIERRDESIDEGLRRLEAAVTDLYGDCSPQEMADGLLRILLPAETEDDVVLVVKHLPAQEPLTD
jgi:Stage II sporulation protein E (SpoIIE)